MPRTPANGAAVSVKSGRHAGSEGRVKRVRTDALVEVKLPDGSTITVELYDLREKK